MSKDSGNSGKKKTKKGKVGVWNTELEMDDAVLTAKEKVK